MLYIIIYLVYENKIHSLNQFSNCFKKLCKITTATKKNKKIKKKQKPNKNNKKKKNRKQKQKQKQNKLNVYLNRKYYVIHGSHCLF
jgi:Flp pilus assembly protein TadB